VRKAAIVSLRNAVPYALDGLNNEMTVYRTLPDGTLFHRPSDKN
jgi:hypothetical protein